jgi:hypothetical protein
MYRVGICYIFPHYLGGGSGLDWMVGAQSNLYPHFTQLHYHPPLQLPSAEALTESDAVVLLYFTSLRALSKSYQANYR